MKNFLALLFITVFFFGNVYAQQNKVYILVDAKYTKKLAYEKHIVEALNTESNTNKEKFECYSFPGNENVTAYFKISKQKKGKPLAKLPANTINPRNNVLNRTLLNNIMNNVQTAYLLKRTRKGYDSYSIEVTSYMQETPEYIAYFNSGGVYEIEKATRKAFYTSTIMNRVEDKLKISCRVEENRTIGYKIEISEKQSLELVPGLGLRSKISGPYETELKYVNQLAAKDYFNTLKGDPISVVKKEVVADNTVEPIAGVSNPAAVSEVNTKSDFFAVPRKEKKVAHSLKKEPIASGSLMKFKESTLNKETAKQNLAGIATKKGYYRVVDGDNLYAISRKFNIPVKRIMALNKLSSYNINVNQQLKVVDDGSIVSSMSPALIERQEANGTLKNYIYKIEQNDTLYSIAVKFKTTIANLCILNKIEDVNHALNIDDELIIRQSTTAK